MIVADKTTKIQNCRQKYDFLKRCLPSSHRKYESKIQIPAKLFRGAWRDCDTNDIFAHCSLIFYFLDFKFSNFVCPSELHPMIWFFFQNSFRKRKYPKNRPNALDPTIFIVLSIVLKLNLLHLFYIPKRKILCYRIFYFALKVEI